MSNAPIRTREAHLVMEALKPAAFRDHERIACLAQAPGLNLPALERWTAQHGAAGFMVRSLSAAGASVPPGVQQQARLIRLRNLMLTAALVEAVRALEVAGIRALSFKGPLLSEVLHGDVGIRPSNDIDLLVHGDEATRARQVLDGMGFSVDDAVAPALVDSDQPHHTGLIRDGVKLELHRRLYSGIGPATTFDALWAAREEVSVGAARIPVLGIRDRVLHLAIHGAMHGFLCLKWLADLAAFAGSPQPTDWAPVLAAVRGQQHEAAFLSGWRHLREDWTVPLPDELLRALGGARGSQATLAGIWFSQGWSWPYMISLHRLRLLPPVAATRSILVLLLRPTSGEWALLPWIAPRTPVIFSVIRPFRLVIRLARSLFFRTTAPA